MTHILKISGFVSQSTLTSFSSLFLLCGTLDIFYPLAFYFYLALCFNLDYSFISISELK